jgi:hypothetical protein
VALFKKPFSRAALGSAVRRALAAEEAPQAVGA